MRKALFIMHPGAGTRPRPSEGNLRGLALSLVVLALIVLCGCSENTPVLKLGGGPNGGTFENVAARVAFILNEKWDRLTVRALPSGGSVANLQNVNDGKVDMGLVFAGDAYLGRQGLLNKDIPKQNKVLALARLYGATAQLVTPANSVVNSPYDLRGRRVAIGSAGTGSALTAYRFFNTLKMWDQIIPIHEGYATAMEDMKQGNIDAVWFQVGYPSTYLGKTTQSLPLRFINLFEAAVSSGFFAEFPFYSAVKIPPNTYRGQKEEIATFQDSALLVSNPTVSSETVFEALTVLFSEWGLSRMQVLSIGWDLKLEKGLTGIKIPLHPGAVQFWRAKGVHMPGTVQ